MIKHLFTHPQVGCPSHALNKHSDSEYELLLLIQIPLSYKLNVTTPEASTSVKRDVDRIIEVTE